MGNRGKEQSIVFQNQSHLVQKMYSERGIHLEPFELCLITDLMVEWTLKGYTKELRGRFDKMNRYINEQYGK